jgi:hypothetical protein
MAERPTSVILLSMAVNDLPTAWLRVTVAGQYKTTRCTQIADLKPGVQVHHFLCVVFLGALDALFKHLGFLLDILPNDEKFIDCCLEVPNKRARVEGYRSLSTRYANDTCQTHAQAPGWIVLLGFQTPKIQTP